MSGTVLCVIDMQPGFPSSEDIIEETIREIKLAKRRNDGIVFVELNDNWNGSTHDELIKEAKSGGYKKIVFVSKKVSDGSEAFLDAAGEAGWFPIKRIRVCGVNRGACVWSTVDGLLRLVSKTITIELAFDATAPRPKI